jgi:hypothetical protein
VTTARTGKVGGPARALENSLSALEYLGQVDVDIPWITRSAMATFRTNHRGESKFTCNKSRTESDEHRKNLFCLPTHIYKQQQKAVRDHTRPPPFNPAIYQATFTPVKQKKRAVHHAQKKDTQTLQDALRKGGNKNKTPDKSQQFKPIMKSMFSPKRQMQKQKSSSLKATLSGSIRLQQLPNLLVKTRRILANLIVRWTRLVRIAKPIRNALDNLAQQFLRNAQVFAAIRVQEHVFFVEQLRDIGSARGIAL